MTQGWLFVWPTCFCRLLLGTVRRCIAPSICTALAKQDETLEDKAVCASECVRSQAVALKDEMQGQNIGP